LTCQKCGAELRPTAKFCDECGLELRPAAVPGKSAEYKQVTVLFADVAHSMDIAAAVSAERLHKHMAEQRYDGTLDKFTGNGLMAAFGAPAALEDPRAARASGGAGHSGGGDPFRLR
jgi:class 3 adenylate cyclase